MTSRTFQRRLKEENRTFKALLDDVRQERALHLVADGEEPIGRVASRLGLFPANLAQPRHDAVDGHEPDCV